MFLLGREAHCADSGCSVSSVIADSVVSVLPFRIFFRFVS